MSTVIVLVLLVTLLACLAVVIGRVIATPDPWDPPEEADHEIEAMAAEALDKLKCGELTLPRRSPWHQ